jgi:hypothetical protein
VRALTRRRRWASASGPAALVEAGWAEVRDTAVDLGVAFDDQVSVRTAAGELVHVFGRPGDEEDALGRPGRRGPDASPEATAALDRLVRLVERARYSRSLPSDATTEERVHTDVSSCVESLRAGAGQRRRTRATWLPASLAQPVSSARRRSRRRAALEPGIDRAV